MSDWCFESEPESEFYNEWLRVKSDFFFCLFVSVCYIFAVCVTSFKVFIRLWQQYKDKPVCCERQATRVADKWPVVRNKGCICFHSPANVLSIPRSMVKVLCVVTADDSLLFSFNDIIVLFFVLLCASAACRQASLWEWSTEQELTYRLGRYKSQVYRMRRTQ